MVDESDIPPEELKHVNELIGLTHLTFALVTQMLKSRAFGGDGDAVFEILAGARAFLQKSAPNTTTGPIRLALDQLASFEQTVRAMAQNPDAWRPQ